MSFYIFYMDFCNIIPAEYEMRAFLSCKRAAFTKQENLKNNYLVIFFFVRKTQIMKIFNSGFSQN